MGWGCGLPSRYVVQLSGRDTKSGSRSPGFQFWVYCEKLKSGPHFFQSWNNKNELMLCKFKYIPRDSESCQPLCQTVMIFRECYWVRLFILNHLSTLNGLFPFPHNCPFWLMGSEGFWTYKNRSKPEIQLHWERLWQNRAGIFPPSSDIFFIFSTSLAKLPFSSCRKRYIIWRSRAKYLIWMIMLQVSHQDCSAWITNYFSST